MVPIFSDPNDLSDRFAAEVERMRHEQFGPGRWIVWQHTHSWRPPTDVYETDEAVGVRVEIAGMREDDFHITLNDQVLVIKGVRNDPGPKMAYHQLEVRYGEFRTEVFLHWVVDSAAITATYHDGFLVVHMPKARSHRVTIAETTDHVA